MKVKNLKGGVGVEIEADLATLTDNDYEEIKKIFLEKLIVVFRNQPVLTLPFAKLSYKMGIDGIANWSNCWWDSYGNRQEGIKEGIGLWHDVLPNPFTYTGPDDKFYVQRVTGQKVNGLDAGIFAEPELDWHSNLNGPTKARGVALQAVSGVTGSGTLFLDTTKAYAAMSDELKKRCQDVVGKYRFKIDVWASGISTEQYAHNTHRLSGEEYYEMPLVNINKATGEHGLYFHFLNDCQFPTDPELKEILKEHCIKDEFIYTHMWEPGDIVVMEQLLTLHKRYLADPELNKNRVLNRYSFNL
jgi:alpha-ketoglutarate-dependent taurine dioxygenase